MEVYTYLKKSWMAEEYKCKNFNYQVQYHDIVEQNLSMLYPYINVHKIGKIKQVWHKIEAPRNQTCQ
jgi:hypothetical protein